MKKLLLIIILSMLVKPVMAQQWHTVYQYKRILSEKEKQLRDSSLKNQPQMAEMLKRVYKRIDNREYIMNFNKTASVFKEKPKLDKPGKYSFGGSVRDRLLYKDLKNGTFKEKRPSMQQVFLISDSLPKYDWQLTNESKQIGKYTAIKAEANIKEKNSKGKEENKKIVAWFTPEIPVGAGPQKFWGLPGLILELNNNGKEVYLLKEIVYNPKDGLAIKAPEKGKKVDQKTFEKERKELMEKMEKMYKNRRGDNGKGGNRIMIVR